MKLSCLVTCVVSLFSSAPAPAAGAPTVLLLPGGGWQHADAETMEPWAQDFEAHGIRALIVTYPLRDVLGAIRAVGDVVVAERERGPVIAYGISAGGTIAAALAANGRVSGAVNVAGPTDFTRWATPTGSQIMGELGMSWEQRRESSPFFRLNGRQSPQLVQCGALDLLVTCDQGVGYVRAAKRGQRDTRLQVMANGHAQSARDRRVAREWVAARWPNINRRGEQ